MSFRKLLTLSIANFLILLLVPTLGLTATVNRDIIPIAGDVYRFQNNFHFSILMVTDEGVLVTDPIDSDAATWLKSEIKKRFDKPVKYLVYSHDHRDHIAGGEVFADAATVIAHEKTKFAILGEKRPTAVPDVTFNDKLTIELGGKTVNLLYVGRGHSDNMIAVHFPAEKILYAVDFISVKRLPYKNLGDAYFPDWIDAIKFVEGLDFEILSPGHGNMGTKDDAVDHRMYLEELYAAVVDGARQGKSLEELQAEIKMENYKDWQQYEAWRPMNIEGIYQRVVLQRRGN
jgi:glyoxylase-like metal-dependent hydrolase (beta-lactamase superfamily II)